MRQIAIPLRASPRALAAALTFGFIVAFTSTHPALAQAPADPPTREQAGAAAWTSLRGVATANEIHYGRHRRYTAAIDSLRYPKDWPFQAEPGVAVRFVAVREDGQGWAAEAIHGAYPDVSCVIWIGPEGTPLPGTRRDRKTGEMGYITCDG